MQFKDYRSGSVATSSFRQIRKTMNYCSQCATDTPHRILRNGRLKEGTCTLCGKKVSI